MRTVSHFSTNSSSRNRDFWHLTCDRGCHVWASSPNKTLIVGDIAAHSRIYHPPCVCCTLTFHLRHWGKAGFCKTRSVQAERSKHWRFHGFTAVKLLYLRIQSLIFLPYSAHLQEFKRPRQLRFIIVSEQMCLAQSHHHFQPRLTTEWRKKNKSRIPNFWKKGGKVWIAVYNQASSARLFSAAYNPTNADICCCTPFSRLWRRTRRNIMVFFGKCVF